MPRKRIVSLVDEEDAERTTATLLASLAARLATLYVISGADAVGSLTAGFAAYGREVGRTEPGARMRRALERSRLGANGAAIWRALRIDEWAATIPPTPVTQQLRNDIALLMADDVEEAIEALPIPSQPQGTRGLPRTIDADFVDFTLGLWAYAREAAYAIEAMTERTMDDDEVVAPNPKEGSSGGSILR